MNSSLDKAAPQAEVDAEGYSKSLGNRQIQMIAIGGAIGVGLFLGAGGRLAKAGPSLLLAYAICGIAAFFVMRALGELVMHKASAGSFVTYSREFIGPWAGFVTGWMFWLNWAFTGVAEITAAGIYVSRWLPDVPQWLTALVALVVLLSVNLLSVKLFGELEFWFAVLKVLAIVAFLFFGAAVVIGGFQVGPSEASVSNVLGHGGFFPHGFGVCLITFHAVIFAYSGIEMVGITAGEAKDPKKVIPKAVNSVIWRICVFYIGSVLLLVMILPWTLYKNGESPFVTVFNYLGYPVIGDVMNFIVLTAALSSANSGLYSTGRILRALADKGEAPGFAGKMSSRHVPYGAIALTGTVYLFGVLLNKYVEGTAAFEIATAIASLGVIATWASFLIAQMRLRKKAEQGLIERPAYRMPGGAIASWGTLAFLGLVVVLMGAEPGPDRMAFLCIPAVAAVLALGWWFVKRRQANRDRQAEAELAAMTEEAQAPVAAP